MYIGALQMPMIMVMMTIVCMCTVRTLSSSPPSSLYENEGSAWGSLPDNKFFGYNSRSSEHIGLAYWHIRYLKKHQNRQRGLFNTNAET